MTTMVSVHGEKGKKMTKDEWNAYQRKYKKFKYKQISLMLRIVEDDDVIERLGKQKSKANYIKRLIRRDMNGTADNTSR